ncbi:hypothetical protein ACQUTG_01010 [Marinobacter sp. DUT-1]
MTLGPQEYTESLESGEWWIREIGKTTAVAGDISRYGRANGLFAA